jgi:hypothetical protein
MTGTPWTPPSAATMPNRENKIYELGSDRRSGIAPSDLAAAMQALVAEGRGLLLVRGLEDADISTVQAALKRRFHADPQAVLAAFVRFRHLAEVFSARRLKKLMFDRGYALLAPALTIAASLRLNAHHGFNLQQFLLALQERLADNMVPNSAGERAEFASELLAA